MTRYNFTKSVLEALENRIVWAESNISALKAMEISDAYSQGIIEENLKYWDNLLTDVHYTLAAHVIEETA